MHAITPPIILIIAPDGDMLGLCPNRNSTNPPIKEPDIPIATVGKKPTGSP